MVEGHADYDALLTTTLRNYRSKLVDNIFSDTPLVDFLKRKDKIRMEDGGEQISVPLLYGKNGTAKSYSGYEAYDLTPQEGMTTALYPWRQFVSTITIDGLTEFQNSGRSRILNLLKGKVMQTEMSIIDAMDEMFFGDGTVEDRDWNGLDVLVNDETGTTTSIGGIDCASDNTWWRSIVTDAGSTERDDSEWANSYYSASKGSDKVDFAITTQALFEHYEASLAPQLRFTSNDSADARFENLAFKKIPLFYDDYCTSGTTYFLNSSYLEIVGAKDNWFKNSGFKEADDRDAKYAAIKSYGNLVVSNRARQARVDAQALA